MAIVEPTIVELCEKVDCRYTLVVEASKRARQLIAGAEPLVKGAAGKKPLSVAIEEFYVGKVKIIADTPKEEDAAPAVTEAASEEAETSAEETAQETAETEE